MIKWLYTNYAPLPPVFIDGLLYVGIAFFGALFIEFTTDDAKQFIPLATLFWLKLATSSLGGSCTALKTFRSTTFADHKALKTGNTQTWPKTSPPTP